MGGDEHRCEWRDKAESLEAEVAGLRATVVAMEGTLSKLQRHVFGKRSEKIPPVAEALRAAGVESDPEAALEKRQENAEAKKALPSREVVHKVRDDQKTCPKCGGRDFTPLGPGKLTEVY
jgi:transposase